MGGRRLGALMVDYVVAALVMAVLMVGSLGRFVPAVIDGTVDADALFWRTLRLAFAACGYFVVRDCLGMRSVGKRWTGLCVRDARTGAPARLWQRFVRNVPMAFPPLEIIAFLATGKRLGDRLAHTAVTGES